MRELIRPALFIIARTGLFLSVVAWIVSQWYVVTLWGNSIRLTCKPRYWSAETGPWWPDTFRLSVQSTTFLIDGGNDSRYRVQYRWGAKPNKPGTFLYGLYLHSIAEVDWKFPPARFRLLLYHWLTVIIFTGSNIALHIIYRKRTNVSPCES